MIRLLGISTAITLNTAATANAVDCAVVFPPIDSSQEVEHACWQRIPGLNTADLALDGWMPVTATSFETTADNDERAGDRAFVELSYWRLGDELRQCRMLIRDAQGTTRGVGGLCYKPVRKVYDAGE